MQSSAKRKIAAPNQNRLTRLDDWLTRCCATWSGRFLFGGALVVIYVAAYHLLWYFSFDQWFLPVGLRAAWLLFAPPRLWPYFFVGDATALMLLRIPNADSYSWQWALISPVLLAPLMALVVAPIRSMQKGPLPDPIYLVPTLVVVSAWAAIYPFFVNRLLAGPVSAPPVSALEEFSTDAPLIWLGSYLGIVTVVAIAQIVIIWLAGLKVRPGFWLEAIAIFVVTPILHVLSVFASSMNERGLITISLAALAVPALLMTLRHGLNGAAVGVATAAFAIAITRDYAGIPGYVDTSSLPKDQSFAVFSSLLLVLGAALARKSDSLSSLGASERKALELARSSFSWAEQNLREKLFFMAQMQMRIDEYRKALVQKLRETGHAEAAMELNASALTHLDWFDQQAAELYPERIERDGLFAALHSPAFGEFWAQGGEVNLHLRGAPKKLSVSLQLAAYRCICNGLALLTVTTSPHFVIRARTWESRTRRGVTMTISSIAVKMPRASVVNALAEYELDGRTKAFGGRYRRLDDHRLSITLVEGVLSTAAGEGI